MKTVIDLLKWATMGLVIGMCLGAVLDHRETKTMGVSMNDIRAVKAECEKSGAECVMMWDFVEVEADYE